jgi:hypothetical protein
VTPFVVSVMHTGTKITLKLLGHPGWRHIGAADLGSIPLDDKLVVIPLRKPEDTAESWRKRGWSLSQLVKDWQALNDFYCQHRALLLPVDHSERDAFLNTIERYLGRSLATDWKPVSDWSALGAKHVEMRRRAGAVFDVTPIDFAAVRRLLIFGVY